MRKWALALVAALVGVSLPMSPARAAPTIEFLNPSDYSTALTISDKTDLDGAYHLVAWIGDVPANPLVEFELQSVSLGAATTVDGTKAGTDTWEGFVTLSGLTDGQYFLRARLYANFTGPGTGEEVAAIEKTVTVNASDVPPPTEEDTVEMTYPENGGPLGVFSPRGKRSNFVVDAVASAGTDSVRVAYTKTAPGRDPEWINCGGDRVEADRTSRIRCTLAEGDSPSSVTAVAAIANQTPPPASPNPVADATGDAHRVAPYVQRSTTISIDPEQVRVEPGNCQLMMLSLTDQAGRPIAVANVDIHAVGPDDQLRFGVIERTSSPQAPTLTSPYQAPDKGHPSSRVSVDCGDSDPQGRQGDHNIPGSDDPQHIESTDGTDKNGRFAFALRSDTVGGTEVLAFSDEDDDDLENAGEAVGGARIGWGEEPPTPTTSIRISPTAGGGTTGSCQRVQATVRRGGSTLAGANVDVHISGPDSSVAFCTPSDASPSRIPDGGSHVSGADDEDTKHLEGETDASGVFVFGVTSGTQGSTEVLVWADELDDDFMDGVEPRVVGAMEWGVSGDRSISISASRTRVAKGTRVRISGSIVGAASCETGQTVKLQARRASGGVFRNVGTTTTADDGTYAFRPRVTRSTTYRTVAPLSGVCEKARSGNVTVRVRR